MSATALRAQADKAIDAAIADFDEQLTKGWTINEAAVVLSDTMTHASALLQRAKGVMDRHELARPVA